MVDRYINMKVYLPFVIHSVDWLAEIQTFLKVETLQDSGSDRGPPGGHGSDQQPLVGPRVVSLSSH